MGALGHAGARASDARDLLAELQRAGLDASTTRLDRALYSSDASLYRVVPDVVVRARDVDDLDASLAVARATGVALTVRGAGTSCAGNAVGPGVVVDTRALNRIREIDPEAATAVVEPGVVQADLQRAAAPHGLRFGPDPSTSSRCTIGGMIGNNACGPRALGYGRTADNLIDLDLALGDGRRVRASDHGAFDALRTVVTATLGTNRTEFGRFSRQVSGYSVEHLRPERGFDVARFWAGTEGTLGLVRHATLRLVPTPAHTVLVALGYPTAADGADAMGALLPFQPTACEGFDARLVDVVRARKGPAGVPDLPRGVGYLIIELAGADPRELEARARRLVHAAGALDARIVDGDERAALWQIRADGAGLAAVALDRPGHAGWEDAAVPPERLGGYLRSFNALLSSHGLDALPYGHFGEGCVHARIDFPLPDVARFRAFLNDAAELVAEHGGSMSGEHGDGRARSELLARMYSPDALAMFAQIKAACDPLGVLNPGIVVEPPPLDADVRLAQIPPLGPAGPFGQAGADAHRCTGVGACTATTGGAMCPSFRATGAERDSTRGRARVLQEMVAGTLITDGWRSREVAEALELCLACKACRRECPTGVDMAELKSVALDERYRGRVRPRAHYALGMLPRWIRLLQRVPGGARAANAALGVPPLARLAQGLAGVDARRSLPRFDPASGARSLGLPVAGHAPSGTSPSSNASAQSGPRVALWVDSFTQGFATDAARAAAALLQSLGCRVELLAPDACCGLTWTTTGQRAAAERRLAGLRAAVYEVRAGGGVVVGLEPSCTAQAREAGIGVHTLAETLRDLGYRPPSLVGHEIVVQPHCHHRAVLGWEADAALLAASGAHLVTLTQCCGLAGNFGVERGHHDVSVAVAELELLPALRAHPDAIVLADGFSCRTQADQLAGRGAMTLAELFWAHTAR